MQASIPTNWRRVKLGDYLSVLTDYHANGSYERLKANVELLDTPSYAVMIRTKNFEQDDFQDDLKYITKSAYDFLQKSKVKPGDILMNKIANAGSIYYMPDLKRPVSLAMNLFLLRTKEEDAHQKYVFYYLKTNETYIKNFATGTAATTITKQAVRDLQIVLPPLPEQKAIAHILGTLDDKIELNREMNRTLEGMARAIFKSWFVDFDPVRAKMEGRLPAGMDAATAELFPSEFEDSVLGMIPRGWCVQPLSEVVDINPRRILAKGETAPYLDMANMPTQGHRPDHWINRPFGSGTKFINGDTLLARITPCLENGKTAFVDFLENGQVGWGSTEYIIFRPKPPLPVEYGYYLARSDDLRAYTIQNMTGSSGRQRAPAECFSQYIIAIPCGTIAKRFGDSVKSTMALISSNSEQSRSLASIRDTLLPKLLSGEIRVKEAEKLLETVA